MPPSGINFYGEYMATIASCAEKFKGKSDGYFGKMGPRAKIVDAYGVQVVGNVGVFFEAVVSNLQIKG